MSPDSDKPGRRAAGPDEPAALSLSSKLDRKRLRKAAHKQVVDLTVGKAHARYVRVTPMKARRVVNLVRGMDADQAITTLRFAPQAAAVPVRKTLQSAVASLVDKRDKAGLDTNQESLYVAEAYVNEGPTMKRFRPRAKGRADRILKRSSHITMVVRQAEEPAASAAGRRGARSGGIGLLRRAGRGAAGQAARQPGRQPAGQSAGRPAKSKASKKGRTR